MGFTRCICGALLTYVKAARPRSGNRSEMAKLEYDDALSDGGRRMAAVTLAVSLVMLPLWDVVEAYNGLVALVGTGLSRHSSAPFPVRILLLPIGGVVAAVLAHDQSISGSNVVLKVACLGVLGYAAMTAWSTAHTRSHAIDSWNLCERPGESALGFDTYVSTTSSPARFDGPSLANGDPCVHEHEQRDVHVRESPDGSLLDGLAQIWNRFPKDRRRIVYGSALAFALLGVSVHLLWSRDRTITP